LIVSDLSRAELARRLAGEGLRLRTGPVVTSIRSIIPSVLRGIELHYARHPLEPDDGFADFHVRVAAPAGPRRLVRPQVFFQFDGRSSFLPLPLPQAFPMLEWGLNWCVSSHCHQYVVVHAAVLARDDRAVLLPAPPGSGKSTLCAALALRGWRLLSDELALIEPESGSVCPLPRPISLKNASIDVIGAFSSEAEFGEPVRDTVKGTVAHMKPPALGVREAERLARPAWVVFPRYVPGRAATMAPLAKAQACMQLIENAFNYDVHGRRAFQVLGDVVDTSACFEFSYGRLEEAMASFAALVESR
jgi:HprK-related kinase A